MVDLVAQIMNNILALDQSSITSGFSVFQEGQLKDYGTFTISSAKDLPTRLVKIREKILELISNYNIDVVYYEDIQLQAKVPNNVKTFKVLSEVIGVVSETCKEYNMRAEVVPPVVWKAAIKIPTQKTRKIQKQLTQEYVLNVYKVEASEDASDAIGIDTYANQKENNIPIPKNSKLELGFDWSD